MYMQIYTYTYICIHRLACIIAISAAALFLWNALICKIRCLSSAQFGNVDMKINEINYDMTIQFLYQLIEIKFQFSFPD